MEKMEYIKHNNFVVPVDKLNIALKMRSLDANIPAMHKLIISNNLLNLSFSH